jgi:CRP/FNR family transcriptional regulator, transcriptional activator FtrB
MSSPAAMVRGLNSQIVQGPGTMAEDKIDAGRLRSIRLFAHVGDGLASSLVAAASLKHVAIRARLFAEGDSADVVFFLMKGSVELFSERDDRRCTIAVLRSVEPLMLASVFATRHAYSAAALERSLLLVVPAGFIRNLMDVDPRFTREVARQLAQDHRHAIAELRRHRLRTTKQRLAEWMLHSNEQAGGTGRFAIPFDKRTLASYLGMAPENLSRNLAALASVGVEVHGRRITLNDPTALAEIAGYNLTA